MEEKFCFAQCAKDISFVTQESSKTIDDPKSRSDATAKVGNYSLQANKLCPKITDCDSLSV